MKLKAIITMILIAAVLGVVFYAVSRPKPTTPVEPRPFVWDFEMDDLKHIDIALREGSLSQQFVKHEDRYFYFDEPGGSIVDMVRWGGGIPLILSGPGAERRIAQNADAAKLAAYGFDVPALRIKLTLNDDSVYNVEVGDSVPGGQTYYVRLAELTDVYTVDYTWYDVIAGLVTNPPFPPAKFVNLEMTVTPAEPRVSQQVTITSVMTNTGAVTETYDVKLMINGTVEQTKTIELARNAKETVVFTMTRDTPGTYSINVEGKTAKLVVQ